MSLQSLPDPYEIAGGGNPYYVASSNIAGLGYDEGDYSRYLQPAAPFLAGLEETREEILARWPGAVASAAYGYVRSNSNVMGVIVGLLAGFYLPKTAALLIAADTLVSHRTVQGAWQARSWS